MQRDHGGRSSATPNERVYRTFIKKLQNSPEEIRGCFVFWVAVATATWFRRRAETGFPLDPIDFGRDELTRKFAIARTRSPTREKRALPRL